MRGGEGSRKALSRRQDWLQVWTLPCVQPLFLLHVANYSCLLSEGWVSGAAGDARVGEVVPGSPAVYTGVGEGRKAVPGRRYLATEKGGVSDHRRSRGGKANPSCPCAKADSSISSELTPPGQRSGSEFCRTHSQRSSELSGRAGVP